MVLQKFLPRTNSRHKRRIVRHSESRCHKIIRFTGSTEVREIMVPFRIQSGVPCTAATPLGFCRMARARKRLLGPSAICFRSLLGSYAICRAGWHVFSVLSRGGVARRGRERGKPRMKDCSIGITDELSLRPMNHGAPQRPSPPYCVILRSIDVCTTPFTRYTYLVSPFLRDSRSNDHRLGFRRKILKLYWTHLSTYGKQNSYLSRVSSDLIVTMWLEVSAGVGIAV